MSPERIALAYLTAARAHAGQRRDGSGDIPYVNHCAEVAWLVAGAGASEDALIAAVLHDVVEDSAMTLAEVERGFGPAVAAMVEALTDEPEWADLSAPERKRLQAERMPDAPAEARAIKIADQTSNLHDLAREPGAWETDDARAYAEASARVVDACRGASPGLEARFDEALATVRRAFARPGHGERRGA